MQHQNSVTKGTLTRSSPRLTIPKAVRSLFSDLGQMLTVSKTMPPLAVSLAKVSPPISVLCLNANSFKDQEASVGDADSHKSQGVSIDGAFDGSKSSHLQPGFESLSAN